MERDVGVITLAFLVSIFEESFWEESSDAEYKTDSRLGFLKLLSCDFSILNEEEMEKQEGEEGKLLEGRDNPINSKSK